MQKLQSLHKGIPPKYAARPISSFGIPANSIIQISLFSSLPDAAKMGRDNRIIAKRVGIWVGNPYRKVSI